jgi:hypothetical protein
MTTAAWTCPRCHAPFVAPNASHSCVSGDLEAHFAAAMPGVRVAFDRLVELATVNGSIPVIAQKTRIVLAAPVRFLAIQVRRDRLTGHLLLDREAPHPLVTAIVPNAYGSGLALHRLSNRDANQLDDAFAAMLGEAAERVGRSGRIATGTTS